MSIQQRPAAPPEVSVAAPTVEPVLPLRRVRAIAGQIPEAAALIVVLAGLVAYFSLASPYFFNTANFVDIAISCTIVGLVACPGTMLLIAGQFDLAVNGTVGLVTAVFAESYVHGNPLWLSVLLALGVGVVVGVINGFLVTVVGINALITTIGMMEVTIGFAYTITDGQAIGFQGFTTLGLTRPLFNIPWMVWIYLAATVVTIFTLRTTTYGRRLFAIGSNPAAARLSGIRSNRVIFLTFVLSGLACGLAGLLLASQTGQGSATASSTLNFLVITAVVLGGASLSGGRGTMLGTFLAVLVIEVINNGIVLLGINSFWQEAATGILLIIAVGIDQLRLRLKAE